MKNIDQSMLSRKRQQGAALIVGLMLLVVITILAVSGMNTATTELAMARNDQSYENAFQAAETGLETALGQNTFNTAVVVVVTPPVVAHRDVSASIQYMDPPTLVPDKAFSIGTGIVARHFVATSTAAYRFTDGSVTDRDATAVHTQAFYKVGPTNPGLLTN